MSFINIQLFRMVPRTVRAAGQIREVHRWVGPTLRELKKRREKMGPEAEQPRSGHSDWNYNAELFAFGKRLGEQFDSKILQQAFCHRSFIAQEERKQAEVGIENPQLGLSDNGELIDLGHKIIQSNVEAFVLTVFPKLPREGINAIVAHLTSEEKLAHVSKHLGTKDIILAGEFPVTEQLLANTLKAVVGALQKSSGDDQVFLFVRDFVCTQLNQVDVSEIWNIEDPFSLLKEYCKEKKMGELEPRSIGLVGKNTLLAAHNVAIYCDKKFMGSGFGEDVQTAIDEAARDCLRVLFGTELNMKPVNFQLSLKDVTKNFKRALNH